MVSTLLPTAMAALADERNTAADAALVEALPHMDPSGQAAALGMLVDRAHGPSLANVVGRFNLCDDGLRKLIVERAGDLFSGVRLAIEGPDAKKRAGAIALIARSTCGPLIYLLADALRSPCRKTRELAAKALRQMTERLLDGRKSASKAGEIAALTWTADGLGEALRRAVYTWELHLRPKVLEAALWISERTEPAIRRKLQEPRTKIARVLNDLLAGTSDPRLVGFSFRALTIPALRASAAGAIGHAADTSFIQAVLEESWLLGDVEIERGCRWIQSCRWLEDGFDEILRLDRDLASRAVRLLAAIGGSPEHKVESYREMIGLDDDALCRAVVWQLIGDDCESAGDLLITIAGRRDDDVARMAARELRRRSGDQPGGQVSDSTRPKAAAPSTGSTFERFWDRLLEADSDELAELERAVRRDTSAMLACVRAKLASSVPLDRVQALRIVHRLMLARELDDQVFRLAHDPDPIVRSQAVGMLADLPGSTSLRILRTAMNDRDARVQANAVEALDLLGIEDRVVETEAKLASPNSRVRANAVKSLLRLEVREAGDALIGMLEDSARSHRLSALWVVEKLKLKAVLGRIEALARDDCDERVRQRARRILRELIGELDTPAAKEGRSSEETPCERVGGLH